MFKKVFIDTNVLLDVLLQREPFWQSAQLIWSLVEQKKIKGAVSAISVGNIFFIVKRLASSDKAYGAIEALTGIFQIVEVSSKTIFQALKVRFPDFEDALQYYCALKWKAQTIITRDAEGFKKSQIPVMEPAQFLSTNLK